MLNVKISYPNIPKTITKADILIPNLALQTPSSKCIWDNCRYYINSGIKDCDYWVVFSDLVSEETARCPPENTIFITEEPAPVKTYDKKFLEQFGTIVTAQNNIKHPHVIQECQILPWYIHKSYDELSKIDLIKKTEIISLVTSNKRFTKGHELRYQFAMNLKEYFGDKMDLFGRGIHNFDDKWDVIAPYKYTIAIENTRAKYYVTEKLTETFLSYTFPFYYGCLNIDDYYPKDSYEIIDINDFDKSVEIIERVINNPEHYEKHLDSLRQAREKYLNRYQLFPLITKIINSLGHNTDNKELITLNPSRMTLNDLLFKGQCLKSNIKNLINTK